MLRTPEPDFCFSMLCPRLFAPEDCDGSACIYEEMRGAIHIYAITPDDNEALVAVQPHRSFAARKDQLTREIP